MVLAPLKLRCCDIVYVKRVKTLESGKMSGEVNLRLEFFKWITSVRCDDVIGALQLVAQHNIRARRGDLMIDVKALG